MKRERERVREREGARIFKEYWNRQFLFTIEWNSLSCLFLSYLFWLTVILNNPNSG